jgi:predicted Zn-dependent protease
MARYLVAAALLIVFVMGSIWAVNREGDSYREALRRQRLAARPSENPAPPAVPPPVVTLKTPDQTRSAPRSSQPSLPEPVRPESTTKSVADAEKPKEPKLAPLLGDAFWDEPEMRVVWEDVGHLKPEDEKRLGRLLNERILRLHHPDETGVLRQRVEEAAEPYLRFRNRKEIDYTFTVLESNAINAFSHPGGYVYVSTGLLNWIGKDQPQVLEFVVAHEIAHVDMRHAQMFVADPAALSVEKGTLRQFFSLVFPLSYADPREFEADAWASRQMMRSGRSPRKTLAFLRKWETYAKENEFGNGRVPFKKNADAAPLENHFKAHPAAYQRLKRVENLAKLDPVRAK